MPNLIPLMISTEDEDNALLLLYLIKKKLQIRTRNVLNNRALPNPANSSWSYLYKYGDDESFISAVGVSRAGFELLYDNFKKKFIIKYNRKKGGRPSKVCKRQALGLLLTFYASTTELKTLGQLHGVRPNTASRILKKAELALEKSLKEEPLAKIRWPTKRQQREWANLVQSQYSWIINRFGFVDGKNFRVQEPSDVDLQNAMYNGWLHSALITGVLCFGVDGTLIWGKHNCVGSWNDGDMSREMCDNLLDLEKTLLEFGVVADTAFPVTKEMRRKIITPLKEGDLERSHPDAQAALLEISSAITSLRQNCEWGVGSIEKVWRQLLLPLPYDQNVRKRRLNNIFRLWNFRVRTTGISQIATYFGAGVP